MQKQVQVLLSFSLFLLVSCSFKEELIQPKAIVISVIGEVSASGKKLNLGQEITNQEIIVGKNSLCDLQLLESDTLVVVRIKSNSKFKLTGKKIGSKKQNFFTFFYGNGIFNVTKVDSKDQIKTLTPTLTAGVRGTKYEVNIQPNGSTQLFVLEGEVSAKPRIPEIDKFSKEEIQKNKVLKIISKTFEKNESTIKAGQVSEFSGEAKKKLLKDTELSESIQKSNPNEIGQNIDINKVEEKLSELETDLKPSTKELDSETKARKLKEYEEITPFEKEKINDKVARNQLIQARFQKIEKSWWEKFQEWLRNLK